jgi:hypothetical protein
VSLLECKPTLTLPTQLQHSECNGFRLSLSSISCLHPYCASLLVPRLLLVHLPLPCGASAYLHNIGVLCFPNGWFSVSLRFSVPLRLSWASLEISSIWCGCLLLRPTRYPTRWLVTITSRLDRVGRPIQTCEIEGYRYGYVGVCLGHCAVFYHD